MLREKMQLIYGPHSLAFKCHVPYATSSKRPNLTISFYSFIASKMPSA